jgi:predicted Zn-dependent peptidase
MEFREARLNSELKIVAEISPDAATMAAGFFVRTGSRDEPPEISGVSHFLEHMVFKGTARRSALDVNLEFDRMGAQYNAFTSEENTVYFASVLPEFQAPALDLLCDILRPALRPEDFETEKGVILDEIAMYEDRPQFRLYDKLMERHFVGHPLGRPILGTPRSIGDLKQADMRDYFERRYSSSNVILAATGAVDFDALVEQAARACAHWQPFDVRRPVEPCTGSGTREILVDADLVRQNLGLMSAAPSCQDEQRFAAQLLATILGDTSGSRLFYALIETARADEAHATYVPMDGAGAIMTCVSCDTEQAPGVLQTVRDEYANFMAAGATEAELQAAKNKIASAATLQGELPMGRLTAVGFDWLYRREYLPLADQIEKLFAVTRQDVHELARTCDLSATTTLALGPRESLEP